MSQTATCELVRSSSLDDLSNAVTNRMVDGWWPLGRPYVRGEQFIQAMVFEPRFDERENGADDN